MSVRHIRVLSRKRVNKYSKISFRYIEQTVIEDQFKLIVFCYFLSFQTFPTEYAFFLRSKFKMLKLN